MPVVCKCIVLAVVSLHWYPLVMVLWPYQLPVSILLWEYLFAGDEVSVLEDIGEVEV